MIGKKGTHFLFTLQVFLLSIAKPVRIINKSIRCKAYKPVMRRTIFFPYEMNVICRYHLDPMLCSKFHYDRNIFFLSFIYIHRLTRNFSLMVHYFQIIVFAKYSFMPFYSLFRPGNISGKYLSRNLSCHTSR